MASKSFAERINDSKLMLAGLQQNPDRLAKRGLDADFVSRYETALSQAQTLDAEQERLKAELSTKTNVLKQCMADLNKLYAEARKIVKIEMEVTSWQEFGIHDKR